MKSLLVNHLSLNSADIDLSESATLFNKTEPEYVDTLLWSNNGYRPEVSFRIAYTDNGILLQYEVAEEDFKAEYTVTNQPIYKDSCVEFFIQFDDEKTYYNLEFNALGCVLGGFGDTNSNRLLIDVDILSQIQTHSIIRKANRPDELTAWKLSLYIPFSVFTQHAISSLHNVVAKGNFYKCGDDLTRPHFLSWSPIGYPTPNFHLSQYFGEIIFG